MATILSLQMFTVLLALFDFWADTNSMLLKAFILFLKKEEKKKKDMPFSTYLLPIHLNACDLGKSYSLDHLFL